MANIINENCTESGQQSCADTFLNLTDENKILGGDTGFRPTFSPAIMKGFVIAMNSVFLPVVVIVGLIGNMATIYVFIKKKRKTSTILLLISLAVADLMCISMQIVYLFVQNRNHHFQYLLPNFVVNGFFMTRAIFYVDGISRWIKVVIVLERCVAVFLPLKVHMICTSKRALIAVVFVFIVVPVSSIPELMYIGVKGDKSSWSTYQMALLAIKENKSLMEWYGNLFQIMYGMTTLLINLMCNIAIVIGIRKSSRLGITNTNDLRRTENQRKMTRMLLKMSMFYVGTCLPKDIGAIILLGDTSGTIVFNGNYYLQSVLLFGLSSSFLNNSVNFIIYGTSLSTFRRMSNKMCCCRGNDGNSSPRIVNQSQVSRCSDHSTSDSSVTLTANMSLDKLSGPDTSSSWSPHSSYM